MGAIFSQLDLEGVKHPVSYASRSCNATEQNYSSFDGECLALVLARSHFRPYLFVNSFTLVTDHEPLWWLMTTQKLTGKLARWSLLLQEYNFVVAHKAGVENSNADCLSRYPLPSSAEAPFLDWAKGDVMGPANFLSICLGAKFGAFRRRRFADFSIAVRMLDVMEFSKHQTQVLEWKW